MFNIPTNCFVDLHKPVNFLIWCLLFFPSSPTTQTTHNHTKRLPPNSPTSTNTPRSLPSPHVSPGMTENRARQFWELRRHLRKNKVSITLSARIQTLSGRAVVAVGLAVGVVLCCRLCWGSGGGVALVFLLALSWRERPKRVDGFGALLWEDEVKNIPFYVFFGAHALLQNVWSKSIVCSSALETSLAFLGNCWKCCCYSIQCSFEYKAIRKTQGDSDSSFFCHPHGLAKEY